MANSRPSSGQFATIYGPMHGVALSIQRIGGGDVLRASCIRLCDQFAAPM